MPVPTQARLTALVEDLGGQAATARVLRVDRSRVSRWLRSGERPDAGNLRKVEALEFVLARLATVYDGPTALRWLEGFNAHLGGRRPVDVLDAGGVAAVIAAIDADVAGAYA